MFNSQVEIITPALAQTLLESTIINRELRERHVRSLANEITLGNWVLNGEPIIISDDGALLDGQHRCAAIIDSGCAIETVVVRGVPANAFETLGTGKPRSFYDVLGIRGEQNAVLLANATKRLWRYYQDDLVAVRKNPTNKQLSRFLSMYPGLRDSVAFVASLKNTNNVMPRGLAAFGHYLFAGQDREKADKFFQQVMAGIGVEAESGPCLLRERLLKIRSTKFRISAKEMTALMIKAWNAYHNNKPIKMLKWEKKEKFPKAA